MTNLDTLIAEYWIRKHNTPISPEMIEAIKNDLDDIVNDLGNDD